MKKLLCVVTTLMLALWCASCNGRANADLEKKVADLEQRAADLEKKLAEQQKALDKKTNDLAALSTAIFASANSGLFRSPLDRFFSEPEFWQNTYEVDPSGPCYKKCADAYAAANKKCQAMTNEAERQTCVNNAYQALTQCSAACRAS